VINQRQWWRCTIMYTVNPNHRAQVELRSLAFGQRLIPWLLPTAAGLSQFRLDRIDKLTVARNICAAACQPAH
jgi:hypothetical protein